MRAHLSLNVADTSKSVDFYSKLFGTAPQKQAEGYAKLDLQEPPLNFALMKGKNISRVSHLGIEVGSREEVDRWHAKIKAQGISTRFEEGSTCCFALQDKFWFADPDGNEWEIFVVHKQLPTAPPATCCDGGGCGKDS